MASLSRLLGFLLWERGKRLVAPFGSEPASNRPLPPRPGRVHWEAQRALWLCGRCRESLCFVGGRPVNRWQQVGHEAIHESGFLDHARWRAVSVLVGLGSG